ncbi:MAG: response regulator [Candidatus Omnitrophica bacterium]|nr:response regulator [Candidatus Omnitrophota bacterium]
MKLILVVDDERDIVEIISELLRGEGYSTLSAYDGEEALESIRRNRPQAVILDIKMPGMDGLQVIEKLKADPELKKTPIIVVTATQVISELRERFQQLQVNRWIAKPFEPEDLLAAVAQTLKAG